MHFSDIYFKELRRIQGWAQAYAGFCLFARPVPEFTQPIQISVAQQRTYFSYKARPTCQDNKIFKLSGQIDTLFWHILHEAEVRSGLGQGIGWIPIFFSGLCQHLPNLSEAQSLNPAHILSAKWGQSVKKIISTTYLDKLVHFLTFPARTWGTSRVGPRHSKNSDLFLRPVPALTQFIRSPVAQPSTYIQSEAQSVRQDNDIFNARSSSSPFREMHQSRVWHQRRRRDANPIHVPEPIASKRGRAMFC